MAITEKGKLRDLGMVFKPSFKWGLCLSHMFFLATSHTKKMKREKCFRHIEFMIFTTIFLNWSFNTRNEKKSYFTL